MGTSGTYDLVWIFHEKLGETTYSLFVKFREVWGILKFFPEFWAPSSSIFSNYMLSEVTLSLLQRSFRKLPLDGREIFENTLINIRMSTLIPI